MLRVDSEKNFRMLLELIWCIYSSFSLNPCLSRLLHQSAVTDHTFRYLAIEKCCCLIVAAGSKRFSYCIDTKQKDCTTLFPPRFCVCMSNNFQIFSLFFSVCTSECGAGLVIYSMQSTHCANYTRYITCHGHLYLQGLYCCAIGRNCARTSDYTHIRNIYMPTSYKRPRAHWI